MAIETHCPNGHRMRVKDHLAGRTGRCPTCGTKFRIEAAAQLPLARLVPLAPAIVATLPRARPLGAGTQPPAGPDARDPRTEGGGILAPAPPGDAAARPAPDRRAWEVVEADIQARENSTQEDSTHDVSDRDMVGIEPVAAAEGGPPPSLHAVIAERPDLTWCIAFPGGDPTEALDAVTMQAWLDGGHATGTEVVWRLDWPKWRPVQEVFPDVFGGGFRF
jgi:hypothetical protein